MAKSRAWIALSAIIVILCIATVQAQQNYNVVEIEVVGNRVASKSLILGVSSLSIGSPITPVNSAETIRRLYGLGIFSDVRVEVEDVSGGVKVYIVVEELPKLSGLVFEGNDKMKTEDLKEKLELGVGGYISPYLVEKKRNEIKELYAEKGYFQAKVTASLDYLPDSSEAILTYKIDEKSKVKVEQVVMTGNERVKANEVVGKMRNRKRGFLKSSDFAQDKYDEDLERVINEFHKKGFIDAYLVSDSMTIDTVRNRMTIHLDVYEGPQYYFGDVEFKSNEELPSDFLASLMKFKNGDVFNGEKYDKSLEEIYSAYYDIGHLNIRMFDDRVTRNDSIIDITYDISEGLPSHINLINIVGNHRTKDKVIRREISAFPGQRFSRALLIRSVRDVMALNYFANVVPTPINLPSGDVDIEFEVEEKQSSQISAGIGYNSTDKAVGNLGMGLPNFRGMGQSLSFNVEFGSNRNTLTLSFTEPWMFGRPTSMGADLFSANRNWYDDYWEGNQGGAIRLGRRLRWPDNFFRVYGAYRLSRSRYYDFDDGFEFDNRYKKVSYLVDTTMVVDTTTLIPVLDESGNQIIHFDSWEVVDTVLHAPYPGSILEYNEEWKSASRFSLSIIRDSRDLPEFATKGSKFAYTFDNTGGPLGGYWEYQKHSLSFAKFIPLIWKFALAAKVEFGMVTSPSGDDRILLSDRFTPGGTNYDGIVRGYDDGSLTPDSIVAQVDTVWYYYDTANFGVDPPDSARFGNDYTTRVRGKYMVVYNFEIQFPIVAQQAYGLLFFDAGNSWLRKEEVRLFTDLYRGVGMGFRIVVPMVGTLGFDFGYALDGPGSRRGWKPHFQIGTTFR